jgi:hypothetical protein
MTHKDLNGNQEVSEQNWIHQILVYAEGCNLLDNIINIRNHNMKISFKGGKIVRVRFIQN